MFAIQDRKSQRLLHKGAIHTLGGLPPLTYFITIVVQGRFGMFEVESVPSRFLAPPINDV